MTTTTASVISVSDLRVGMYVHLDLGWMAHPFPLSSFRISSADEIKTIAGLGLKSVRWNPQRSDPAAPPGGLLDKQDTAAQAASRAESVADARALRRAELQAQRNAEAICQRQHAEASRAWRDCQDQALSEPRNAGSQTEALAQALLQKMLVDDDLCIRALAGSGADRGAGHALNVTVVAMLMGRHFGLGADDMVDLGAGALMHDIGKIELPDRVRHSSPAFTAAENRIYREHVTHGVALARRMELSPGAQLVVAQHHEAADGSGFPLQLNLDRMSAAARIVALVNRYDNLCNPVTPGHALTPHEALSLLFAQGRDKFDASMLNTFIRMMGVYPPGSLVQLTDDRYARVVSVNSSRPLKPRVLVHDPKVDRDEALYLDIELQPDLGIRRSLKASQLPTAALDYLAPPQRVAYFFEPYRGSGAEAPS